MQIGPLCTLLVSPVHNWAAPLAHTNQLLTTLLKLCITMYQTMLHRYQYIDISISVHCVAYISISIYRYKYIASYFYHLARVLAQTYQHVTTLLYSLYCILSFVSHCITLCRVNIITFCHITLHCLSIP